MSSLLADDRGSELMACFGACLQGVLNEAFEKESSSDDEVYVEEPEGDPRTHIQRLEVIHSSDRSFVAGASWVKKLSRAGCSNLFHKFFSNGCGFFCFKSCIFGRKFTDKKRRFFGKFSDSQKLGWIIAQRISSPCYDATVCCFLFFSFCFSFSYKFCFVRVWCDYQFCTALYTGCGKKVAPQVFRIFLSSHLEF